MGLLTAIGLLPQKTKENISPNIDEESTKNVPAEFWKMPQSAQEAAIYLFSYAKKFNDSASDIKFSIDLQNQNPRVIVTCSKNGAGTAKQIEAGRIAENYRITNDDVDIRFTRPDDKTIIFSLIMQSETQLASK